MFLFVLISLVLLWLFQVLFLETFYTAIKRSKVEGIVNSIQDIVTETKTTDLTGTAATNALLRIAATHDATALLTDASGTPYQNGGTATRDNLARLFANEEFLQIFQAAKDNPGKGQYLTLSNSELLDITTGRVLRDGQVSRISNAPATPDQPKAQSLLYAKVVKDASGNLVGIIVIQQLTPVTSTVETLRAQLVYVTLIMLAIAAFVALFIAKKIAKPIEDIGKAAKTLGKERYNHQLPATAIREVRDLNDTLRFVDGELEKTERIRKELIANISHDLRTPLTMIKGYSEVMRDIPGEATQENIQVIIDEAERLQSLVNDILVLSRIEEQGLVLRKETYSLTASIRTTLDRYRTLLEAKGYRFDFDADADADVHADPLKISQVLYNLLNNAVTYTGEDKTIRLTQRRTEDGWIRVEIRDSGTGIPDEKLEDIWERYYKVDAEHKRAQMGSGLGLSIVRAILAGHDGRVGVKTSPEGTTFWFELEEVR